MSTKLDYDDATLNHLKDVELMILKDFNDICEKYNLIYYAYGGTALGAIRHGGFIPWDDDVDVLMFREDYEKFLSIMKSNYLEKYYVLNMNNNDDYLYMFSKMCLKNTKFEEKWAKTTSFDVGINIDIFVLDSVPKNEIKLFIYINKCKLLRRFGDLLFVLNSDTYSNNLKKILGFFLKFIFKIMNISNKTFKKIYNKLINNSTTKHENLVYDCNAVCYNKPFPKEIFYPPKKVKFESIEINVPNDVDTFLRITFGDYMKLPPEDQRVGHVHEFIDFGEY